MRRLSIVAGLFILGVILSYFLFWPTKGRPVDWKAPKAPWLETGPYAGNDRLKAIRRIATGVGYGPDSLAIEPSSGDLLTGYANGTVVRTSRDGRRSEIFGNTGGRPLGLAVCPDGSILVADALKGLVRIAAKGAPAEVLATEANGVAFGLVNNITADAQCRYAYFTDASSRWGPGHEREDIVEHGGHGRLLRYELSTGKITLIMAGINFANGVVLGPDEKYVLLNESGSYRTLRIFVSQDRFGDTGLFADNMPGFPDNVSFNGKDRVWVALPVPRYRLLDFLSDSPFLRTIILRVMAIVHLPIKHRAMAMAYDLDGHLVANLQYEGEGAYYYITQVTEVDGDLYFGSLYQDSLGVLPNWQSTVRE
jgi:sugar lactone lactonase YvrE